MFVERIHVSSSQATVVICADPPFEVTAATWLVQMCASADDLPAIKPIIISMVCRPLCSKPCHTAGSVTGEQVQGFPGEYLSSQGGDLREGDCDSPELHHHPAAQAAPG